MGECVLVIFESAKKGHVPYFKSGEYMFTRGEIVDDVFSLVFNFCSVNIMRNQVFSGFHYPDSKYAIISYAFISYPG